MFDRSKEYLRSKAVVGVPAVTALVVSGSAMAEEGGGAIDVSAATSAISSAITGGSSVLIALIGAFGLFLGYKIVMGIVKRG